MRAAAARIFPQASMAIAPTDLDSVVKKHVLAVEAIDVHTHLLPSTHADLMLFGVDELLTYHYLVAELFMIMPLPSEGDSMVDDASTAPPSHDEFFAWPKSRQADLVFEELFVKRTPLSEACRGVITTLNELGLGELLRTARAAPFNAARLAPLREWFASRDPAEYLEHVFTHSKLKYAVMTNIPFVAAEAEHWLLEQPPFVSPRLKTALRVDPVLTGDWITISNALQRWSWEVGGRMGVHLKAAVHIYLIGSNESNRSILWHRRRRDSPTRQRSAQASGWPTVRMLQQQRQQRRTSRRPPSSFLSCYYLSQCQKVYLLP